MKTRGAEDFDVLGLVPPLNHRLVSLRYVNELGSLIQVRAQIGYISICGDAFTIKIHGKKTYDTVVAVRADNMNPHRWMIVCRTSGKPKFVIKSASWDPFYNKRFKSPKQSPGQFAIGI